MTNLIDDRAPLDDDHSPERVIDRIDAFRTLVNAMDAEQPRHLYCYGPRGSGKTLLVRKAVDTLPPEVVTCYCPGTECNTQYQVLVRLLEELTDESIGSGYHTGQLQDMVVDAIEDERVAATMAPLELPGGIAVPSSPCPTAAYFDRTEIDPEFVGRGVDEYGGVE